MTASKPYGRARIGCTSKLRDLAFVPSAGLQATNHPCLGFGQLDPGQVLVSDDLGERCCGSYRLWDQAVSSINQTEGVIWGGQIHGGSISAAF